MYDQTSTYEPDANEHGSRLDPVLARSWLLVNGAQFDRFAPATRSSADIVIIDIDERSLQAQGHWPWRRDLLARLMRRVELPQMGRAFNHSFMAFFACARDVGLPQVLALVEDALARCATPVLTLGLQAQHPYLPALLRHFKPLHYRTRIYAVHFEEPPALDGRMAQPEVATL